MLLPSGKDKPSDRYKVMSKQGIALRAFGSTICVSILTTNKGQWLNG